MTCIEILPKGKSALVLPTMSKGCVMRAPSLDMKQMTLKHDHTGIPKEVSQQRILSLFDFDDLINCFNIVWLSWLAC